MKEEDHELIDKIILGRATKEEVDIFHARLKEREFQEGYEQLSHLHENITFAERRRLKMLLEKEELPGRRIEVRPILKYAAVFAAIIALVLFASQITTVKSSAEIVNSFYSPYMSMDFAIPRGEAVPYELKLRAYEFYKRNKNDSMLRITNQLLLQHPQDEEVILLAALANLQSNRYDEAITLFNQLRLMKSEDHVQWYLSLALIGANREKEAVEILNELSLRERYQIQSRTLLDRLE